MKAGLVSLIGRPNAGKSTLLNRLVGQKVAIVSDKPQTTRHRIVGVHNAPAGQIVFLDTPGIHKPLHRMNQRMVDAAIGTLKEVDVAVLVVDAATKPGSGDAFVLDVVSKAKTAVLLALNKIDQLQKSALLPMMQHYSRALAFKAIVPISALSGDGVSELESEIFAALPEGPPLYPEPIVVGKAGSMIKRIGTEARHDLEAMLGGRVHLELHVKVRTDWRDDERLLREMGLGRR
jgi:GTP-binding protein Era